MTELWGGSIISKPSFHINSKLYTPFFLSLTVIVVVTVLVATTILYVNFESEATDQIYKANMKNLQQISYEVKRLANSAMTVSNQIFQDVTVAKLLYYSEPDIYDLGPALRQLSNYRFFISSIDSIYVYNSNTGTMYVEGGTVGTIQSEEKGFSDKEVINIISHFHDYSPYIPIAREYTDESGTTRKYYTFLMYDFLTGKALNGAVVINISAEWIQEVIREDIEGKSGDTFIIDSSGKVVSDSLQYPMMTDLSQENYIQRILSNGDKSEYFMTKIHDEQSLVAFTEPDSIGWRYIHIIPRKDIFEKIDQSRTLAVWLCLGLLLIGISISFFVSGKLSQPIGKMINSLENFEREKRINSGTLCQELLRDIALGRTIGLRSDLEKRCTECELQINLDELVIAVLLRIDDYSSFIGQNDVADRNLYRFAIANIADELLEVCGKTESVDLGADTIIVAVTWDKVMMEDTYQLLRTQVNRIQEEVNRHCSISLSAAYILQSPEKFEHLAKLVPILQEAIRHRLFVGHGSVIDAKDILQLRNKQYIYPLNQEKTMIDLLMAGKIDDAKVMCMDIISDTSQYPAMASSMTITHLAFTLNQTIHLIVTNNTGNNDENFHTPQIIPLEVETLEDVANQFNALFDTFADWQEERKNERHNHIVEKIHEIINSEYNQHTLSVDSIANTLGLSTPHMSRIYKQYTLHTVLEDIILMRMGKARELLLVTEDPISDIANNVGFANSTYFYKAFKQMNGVTPNEYRKNFR